MKSHINYFKLERERQELAFAQNLSKLKKTYNSKLSLKNGNSAHFWDSTFTKSQNELKNFPMEAERNHVACEWFKEMVKPHSSTLNIGCGSGKFEYLLNNEELLINHEGVDIAPKIISKLKNNFPKFTFNKKNVISSSIPAKKYHVITMFEVLEHLQPKHTFFVLKKIRNSLRPNGYFLISVPINENLDIYYPYNPNEHQRCYSEELIKAELIVAGYKILRTKVFFAFSSNYKIKSFIAKNLLRKKWKPNNILLAAQYAK